MRRIAIQLVGTARPDGDAELFALCNDGTMWQLVGSGQWHEMPGIPQTESEDPLAKLYARNVDLNEALRKAKATVAELLKNPNACMAVQHGDQTVCEHCDIGWDTNDPHPPMCGRRSK